MLGKGHIAVVDTKRMTLERYIDIPCNIPSSCCFAGEISDILAITTASYGADIKEDGYAGHTILLKIEKGGRKPYLFG